MIFFNIGESLDKNSLSTSNSHVYSGNNCCPESPCTSEKHLQWDDASLHNSIQDSPQIIFDLRVFKDDNMSGSIDTEGVDADGSNVCSCKYYGWKAQKRFRPELGSEYFDDCTNPLLNTNAIHERKSYIFLDIEADSSSGKQESDERTLNQDNDDSSISTGLDPPGAYVSAPKMTFPAPLIDLVSPCYAKHERKKKFVSLDAIKLGSV